MVGWAVLWRGILVCNVFDKNPALHDVPAAGGQGQLRILRLPQALLLPDPGHHRQPEQRLHKYIEMETDLQRRPEAVTAEEECFHQKPHPQTSFDGWRATTWSMPIPILSWKGWSPGCTIDADETIVQPMHHKLLPGTSGSISDNEPTQVTSLPVLATGFPAMSMDDDVVCLLRASHAPLTRWKW
ncbi:hypothetical protein D1007_25515 [Hordeum vulgare]|nr:hypothetical protein D1007_25515 [Hordeum vulgare]